MSLTPAEVAAHALAKPGAWEDSPWEGDVVAKVHTKIFVFLGTPARDRPAVTVKCGHDRDEADVWLQRYPGDATAARYIGRSGWNTLALDGGIPREELLEAVDDSYARVVAGLPRKHRPPGGSTPVAD
jgi:predicted DNA-binding protein (MmcQ/YjbR family)